MCDPLGDTAFGGIFGGCCIGTRLTLHPVYGAYGSPGAFTVGPWHLTYGGQGVFSFVNTRWAYGSLVASRSSWMVVAAALTGCSVACCEGVGHVIEKYISWPCEGQR